VASAAIECVGVDLIKNDAQAKLGLALIQSFGDSSEGFLYFEPCTARSSHKPPDAVTCTRDLGVVVIECKGYSHGSIERVQAGTLHRRVRGRAVQENPLDQVRSVMFDIKNAAERRLLYAGVAGVPIFSYFVALPNYSVTEWQKAGFLDSFPKRELLLLEDLAPRTLQKRMGATTAEDLRKTGRAVAITPDELRELRAVFGDSALLNSAEPFQQKKDDSLGLTIAENLASDKELSAEQRQISELEIGSYPRVVRGVAGSGKTVVLAIQVARYLAANYESSLFEAPDRQIAAICFNRCFAPLLRKQIAKAYRARTHVDNLPPSLRVSNLNQLMYHLISKEGGWPIDYIRVDDLPDSVDRAIAYSDAINVFAAASPEYYETLTLDAIFVDEGQDFEPEEYLLLQRLLKPDPSTGERALIIFYDDAQNLYAKRRPVWRDLGIDVSKGNRSRVMRECFRNTREIVSFAFNILLGSQAYDPTLVKTREFAGLSELKQSDLVVERNGLYDVKFAEREGERPIVAEHSIREDELKWLEHELAQLIMHEQVEPHHILVVCRSRELCDIVREHLSSLTAQQLVSHLRCPSDKSEKDELIFHDRDLTISTVKSAKGYEAQVVFMVGTEAYSIDDEARAEFYVGATRAQLRLYVSGLYRTNSLFQEAGRLDALTSPVKLQPVRATPVRES